MSQDTIPVIDINELHKSATLRQVDQACREWGFFQVINHGIPSDAIDAVTAQMRAFFALPVEVKRAISRTRENPWGFFDRELTKNVMDLKQVYDFGPGDGASIYPQWPAGMQGFHKFVLSYFYYCESLAHRLLAAISTNLGMSPGFLSRGFGAGHTSFLRLNYYPVFAPHTELAAAGFGVGQHTDAGALTLLLQDDQPGLEVFKNQEWCQVEPRRNALVINIGDIVQVWSNDQYCATLHRVIASAAKPRFSIPFFLNPEYASTYAPVPTTVTENRPARYRPINWGEFRRLRADGDFADYGEEVQIDHYRIQA